ncbi:VWA domain-containing protein [Bremerella cremea]|uniref:VWA domain-containing protein n=1 Tax=Bremerella cremea TaxID=1031537 RepID=A0A368KTL6_9BACT|nr:VIT domain-containing protein [Bremerella cremea]RCS53010.1 VWA domain-containing protein [Bremerella cremea]
MTRTAHLATSFLATLCTLLLASGATAQALIVIHHPERPVPLPRPIPRPASQHPTESYKITKLEVNAKVKDQVAQVQVAQQFQNTGSRQMEVSFLFPLPYDGAIDSLTLMVDGKEFPAKLLEKEKAREIYNSIVRQNKDPALLEWAGTGMFQTSVFPVPAGASREVTITYSQLLKKDGRLTDFLFPLSTAKYTDRPVEKLKVRLSLEGSEKLKSIYSPTHNVDIERNGNKRAIVKYEADNVIPDSDFRLFFESSNNKLAASVLSYRPDKDEEGFFLLLATPPPQEAMQEPPKKTVLFVVDRSGSMAGEKFVQARQAAKYVLNHLNEQDLFNIIAYDSDVESFQPELQKANKKSVEEAIGFVDDLYAGGSTNIDGALSTAMKMVQDDDRPCYILFLSDGRPTHGETNEMKIVEHAKKQNAHHARMINVGVGYDVNSRLMDRLSSELKGQSQYVRPDEDLEEHVARLYRKINAPLMTDVKIKFDLERGGSKAVNRVLPKEVVDLFEGEQLVLVGRYKAWGDAKIIVSGKVNGETERFDFPAEFVHKSDDQSNAFVEKLWAIRRIGEIIDEMDLHGKNDELIEELVRLSTDHGILTPYTSFLADENQSLDSLAANRFGGQMSAEQSRELARKLGETSGRSAFSQRDAKSRYQNAQNLPQAQPAPGRIATSSSRRNRGRSGGMGGFGGGGFGGGGFGGGGFGGGGNGAEAANGVTVADTETDEVHVVDTVRIVGNRTLYYRDKTWIDEEAVAEAKKPQPNYVDVKRFSDAYFDLVAHNNKAENAVLSQQNDQETLVIKLRGKVYRIR